MQKQTRFHLLPNHLLSTIELTNYRRTVSEPIILEPQHQGQSDDDDLKQLLANFERQNPFLPLSPPLSVNNLKILNRSLKKEQEYTRPSHVEAWIKEQETLKEQETARLQQLITTNEVSVTARLLVATFADNLNLLKIKQQDSLAIWHGTNIFTNQHLHNLETYSLKKLQNYLENLLAKNLSTLERLGSLEVFRENVLCLWQYAGLDQPYALLHYNIAEISVLMEIICKQITYYTKEEYLAYLNSTVGKFLTLKEELTNIYQDLAPGDLPIFPTNLFRYLLSPEIKSTHILQKLYQAGLVSNQETSATASLEWQEQILYQNILKELGELYFLKTYLQDSFSEPLKKLRSSIALNSYDQRLIQQQFKVLKDLYLTRFNQNFLLALAKYLKDQDLLLANQQASGLKAPPHQEISQGEIITSIVDNNLPLPSIPGYLKEASRSILADSFKKIEHKKRQLFKVPTNSSAYVLRARESYLEDKDYYHQRKKLSILLTANKKFIDEHLQGLRIFTKQIITLVQAATVKAHPLLIGYYDPATIYHLVEEIIVTLQQRPQEQQSSAYIGKISQKILTMNIEFLSVLGKNHYTEINVLPAHICILLFKEDLTLSTLLKNIYQSYQQKADNIYAHILQEIAKIQLEHTQPLFSEQTWVSEYPEAKLKFLRAIQSLGT